LDDPNGLRSRLLELILERLSIGDRFRDTGLRLLKLSERALNILLTAEELVV
jgi:hypothetical protein